MGSDRKLSLELQLEPLERVCRKCHKTEGEHSYKGNYCPQPEKIGEPIWSTEIFEPETEL
jgi:hypothetical protein